MMQGKSLTDPYVLDQEGRWDSEHEDEHLWWPRVLWLDPGTASGVSCVWFDPVALFEGKPMAKVVLAFWNGYLHGPENGPEGQVARFLEMRDVLSADASVGLVTGCETFIPRRISFDAEFLSPVRIRAAVEFQMSIGSLLSGKVGAAIRPLALQAPSEALPVMTDIRLRQWRMYTPGADHARDATRHCLLWIRKLSNKGVDYFHRWHGKEAGWDVSAQD